jgi:hypothetical protein
VLLTQHTLTLHAAAGDGGLLARVDSPEVKFTAIGRGMQDDRWAVGARYGRYGLGGGSAPTEQQREQQRELQQQQQDEEEPPTAAGP